MTNLAEKVLPKSGRPVIGKDILELLSTAMYVEPLTIYREYVQNSADAIDAACSAGLLSEGDGLIEIRLDQATRNIRIRDNGIGIPLERFAATLTAIGASTKRGSGARGFRGVGRLSGLAYARELTFRSSAKGESNAHSLTWNCQALKSVLRDFDDERELSEIVEAITQFTQEPKSDPNDHFFEVCLTGVPRIGDDRLLSEAAISDYLSQVGPVPFDTRFSAAAQIDAKLAERGKLTRLSITVNEGNALTRPYLDEIPIQGGRPLKLRKMDFVEIPGVDGEVAAVAWLAHHDYEGAVSSATLSRGLRARVGDIQVGDASVLEDVFPESRFNAWTVGEVHILDSRIIPNGRRDDFERNVHLANLKNHLSLLGRGVAARCRSSSRERKRLRDFELAHSAALENLAILAQGALSATAREEVAMAVDLALLKLEKLRSSATLLPEEQDREQSIIDEVRERLGDVAGSEADSSPLARMAPERRALYEEMFALIYDCSVNRASAKALVDRILSKI